MFCRPKLTVFGQFCSVIFDFGMLNGVHDAF
jgi:hypothetical protein